jgi:hypothetical protein
MTSLSVRATIPATDFARGLSDYLNQVQYRGQVLDISRGKKIIARVMPAGHQDGFPIDQLDALFASLPRLEEGDADAFIDDIKPLRQERVAARDPWDETH